MKKMKMLEQEINKCEGMRILLEQQRISLEGNCHDNISGAQQNVDIFDTLTGADKAIKQVQAAV